MVYILTQRVGKQNSTFIDHKANLFFAQDAEKICRKNIGIENLSTKMAKIQINSRGKSKVKSSNAWDKDIIILLALTSS